MSLYEAAVLGFPGCTIPPAPWQKRFESACASETASNLASIAEN